MLLGIFPSSYAINNNIQHTITNKTAVWNLGSYSYTNTNPTVSSLTATYAYKDLKVEIVNVEDYPESSMKDYWKVTYKINGVLQAYCTNTGSQSVYVSLKIGNNGTEYADYSVSDFHNSYYIRYDGTQHITNVRKNDTMKIPVIIYATASANMRSDGYPYNANARLENKYSLNLNTNPALSVVGTSKRYMNEELDKNSVTLSGKAWDHEGDAISIKLKNDTKEKVINIEHPPTTQPTEDNFSFTLTQADFDYKDISASIYIEVEDTHEDKASRRINVIYDRKHPSGVLNTPSIKGGNSISVDSDEGGTLILTRNNSYNQIEDVDTINSIFYPINSGTTSTATSNTLSGVYSVFVADSTGNVSTRIGIVEIDSKAPKVLKCYIDGDILKIVYDEIVENIIAPDDIFIKSKELYSNFVKYIIGEQELEYEMVFDDYEGDPKLLDAFMFTDFDNSMFDNKNGVPDFINKELRTPKLELPNVGKYNLLAYQIDNPSSDPKFSSFQKKSNEINIELLAHRRPIMDLMVSAIRHATYYDINLNYYGYDLDHEFNRPDKGIVEVVCEYRLTDASTWTKGFPPNRLPVVDGQDWVVRVKGKDPEGAWSKYAVDYIKETQQTFEVDVELNPEYPAGIPITEELNIITTVKTGSLVKSVTAVLNGKTFNIPLSGDNKSLSKAYMVDYIVPKNTNDKDYYELPVTVILSNGATKTVTKKVKIDTPIDLKGFMPEELRGNYEQSITAETSKYADVVYVNLFKGESFEEFVNLTERDQEDDKKTWEAVYTTSELIPEKEYMAEFIAMLPSGKVEKQMVPFKVKHLALYDFMITQITDKDFDYLSNKIYRVSDMPIDQLDHKDKKLMKLGYGFYFEMKSKGLKGNDDFIRIRPKFYNAVTREELDLFYHLEDNSYIKATTSDGMRDARDTYEMYYSKYRRSTEKLGFINELEIHLGLREDKGSYHLWKARYGC